MVFKKFNFIVVASFVGLLGLNSGSAVTSDIPNAEYEKKSKPTFPAQMPGVSYDEMGFKPIGNAGGKFVYLEEDNKFLTISASNNRSSLYRLSSYNDDGQGISAIVPGDRKLSGYREEIATQNKLAYVYYTLADGKGRYQRDNCSGPFYKDKISGNVLNQLNTLSLKEQFELLDFRFDSEVFGSMGNPGDKAFTAVVIRDAKAYLFNPIDLPPFFANQFCPIEKKTSREVTEYIFSYENLRVILGKGPYKWTKSGIKHYTSCKIVGDLAEGLPDGFVTSSKTQVDPDTGFKIGGKNSTHLIRQLSSLNGATISTLEEIMRPGASHTNGSRSEFLGNNESLIDVLAEDNHYVVDQLGLTHQQLVFPLRLILQACRHGLVGDDEFAYKGEVYSLSILGWMGFQTSPFGDDSTGSQDCVIRNLTHDTKISFPSLGPELISRYGFYEGKGTRYRVDPRDILKVFPYLLDAQDEEKRKEEI